MLVLEDLEHALNRGARIYAEVLGFGTSNDAYHPIAPLPDGRGGARAMRAALDDAGIAPDEVDHINAHAASTPAGDLAESEAIRLVYGERAASIPVTSMKGALGHCMGASGALETIAAVRTISDQTIPPTLNYRNAGRSDRSRRRARRPAARRRRHRRQARLRARRSERLPHPRPATTEVGSRKSASRESDAPTGAIARGHRSGRAGSAPRLLRAARGSSRSRPGHRRRRRCADRPPRAIRPPQRRSTRSRRRRRPGSAASAARPRSGRRARR